MVPFEVPFWVAWQLPLVRSMVLNGGCGGGGPPAAFTTQRVVVWLDGNEDVGCVSGGNWKVL